MSEIHRKNGKLSALEIFSTFNSSNQLALELCL